MRDKPIFTDDDRTQRQTVALRDVRYRFAASICPRPDFEGTAAQLYAQALRRIREGKTFAQPALGLKEFVAYFQEGDPAGPEPIPVDMAFRLFQKLTKLGGYGHKLYGIPVEYHLTFFFHIFLI